MKILVTGGAGFIGSAFVRLLMAETDWRVLNLDKLTYAGNLENLAAMEADPRYRFVHGDICDSALVDSLVVEEKPDAMVHFAAESHVDRSILSPEPVMQTTFAARSAYWKRLGVRPFRASCTFPRTKSMAAWRRRSKPPKSFRLTRAVPIRRLRRRRTCWRGRTS